MEEIWAVVPAAGIGSRMKADVKKPFIQLDGKEILVHTLEALSAEEEIEGIVILSEKEEVKTCERLVEQYGIDKVRYILPGGSTRQQSVYRGLSALPKTCTLVLIHDAARPCITHEQIQKVIQAGLQYGAAILTVPVKDTIKVSTDGKSIENTPSRQTLYAAQTPQVFRYPDIYYAHSRAKALSDLSCTDDSEIIEKYGEGTVHMVGGSYDNIKITTPEDLIAASRFLAQRGK